MADAEGVGVTVTITDASVVEWELKAIVLFNMADKLSMTDASVMADTSIRFEISKIDALVVEMEVEVCIAVNVTDDVPVDKTKEGAGVDVIITDNASVVECFLETGVGGSVIVDLSVFDTGIGFDAATLDASAFETELGTIVS